MSAPLLVGPGDADERVVRRWGGRALGLLARHAPDAASLAAAVAPAGLDGGAVVAVHGELLRRLRTVPASAVCFDLAGHHDADLPGEVGGGGDGVGVALARLAGLAVRGEPAPAVLGVRTGPGEAGWGDLAAVVAAVVATAERGADAPEVELGSLPGRLLVTRTGSAGSVAAGGAPGDDAALRALERAHGLAPGWLELRAEPAAPSGPVPADDDAAAVRRAVAEHARLALAVARAGEEPGYDLHPAHLVARHLAELLLAAG